MDSLQENPILLFHPDTLHSIRKIYKLDSPARLEEAIKIFQEWIKKQSHFTRKEFDKDFLERWIITNKGQLERAKMRLDKTCTLRTFIPEYFSVYNVKEDLKDAEPMQTVVLPKQTDDFYRIVFVRHTGEEITSTMLYNFYRKTVILWEYLLKHDYSTGYIIIYDLSKTNLMEMVTHMGLTELRQNVALFLQGYGMRIKAFHIITPSKYVEALVLLLKQIFSSKIGQRIQAHTTVESLHEVVPKNLLPQDYGGKESPLSELTDKWIEVLSSDENVEYLKKSYEARTDEANRSVDSFNEQHFGTPGSFKILNVD